MRKLVVSLMNLALLSFTSVAIAGEITLTGTDIISLHQNHPNYAQAVWYDFTEGVNSSLPILVVSQFGLDGGYVGWPGGFSSTNSLTGFTPSTLLSNYAGVWLASPFKCCADPSSNLTLTDAAVIHSYLAMGGNLGVEDFLGASFCGGGPLPGFWDTVLGFDPLPGRIGTGCNNAKDLLNVFASQHGLQDGFPATGRESVWNHQVYDPAFWSAHGFNVLLYAGTNASGPWQAMDFETTPEPTSLVLVGTGVLGLVGAVRRKMLP